MCKMSNNTIIHVITYCGVGLVGLVGLVGGLVGVGFGGYIV